MALLGTMFKAVKLPDRLPLQSARMGMGYGLQLNNSAAGATQSYKSVGTLYGTVNRIAEAVSLTQWTLYKMASDKSERTYIDDATAPPRHPATAIWTHPNPDMTRKTFLHRTVQKAVLTGEAYWLLVKAAPGTQATAGAATSPFELWPVVKGVIVPIQDENGYLIGYMYVLGLNRVPLPKEAVIPVCHTPDPDNMYHGFGPVQSMMADLDSERFAAQMQRNSMVNGGQPGGVIEFDTKLTPTDWDEFQMRWREQHQGVANVNRVAVLERAHWVDAKMTYRDLQFEQLRKMNRDLIFAPFGMHGAIMGVAENVNRANAEAAEVTFSRWIVRPKLEEIKEALNERVLPYIDSDLTMDYTDPTPNDLATNTNVAIAFWLSQLKNRNDALQMGGFDVLDGPEGDEYLQPAPTPMATPPHVQPPGRGVSDTITKWPAGFDGHERGMAASWRERLATVGAEAIDYVERRNGKH